MGGDHEIRDYRERGGFDSAHASTLKHNIAAVSHASQEVISIAQILPG